MTRILCDMDGTICNWGKQWDWYLDNHYDAEQTVNIARHAQQKSFDLHDGLTEAESAIVDAVMDTPGFYAELEPIPSAIDALREMLEQGYEVFIVTSPWLTNETCVKDKIGWVTVNLGEEWTSRVIVTKDKTLIAGDYLIDDKPEIKGVAKPTWEHIVFDQPYNQYTNGQRLYDWEAWDDIIRPKTPKLDALMAKPSPFVSASEVRSVSSTGGEKGVKEQRFDLIPVGALTALATHYGVGARKYDDNQWRKGYEWSKSYAAIQRHLNAFWGGEDFDEETGSNHMAAVAWHAFTLLTFFEEFPEFDDRFKGTP